MGHDPAHVVKSIKYAAAHPEPTNADLAKMIQDIARGPHLMATSVNHQICHDPLEDTTIIAPPPTLAELQMRLTTAEQTVEELTSQVLAQANALGVVEVKLAERDAECRQLKSLVLSTREEVRALAQKLCDAETALACERFGK